MRELSLFIAYRLARLIHISPAPLDRGSWLMDYKNSRGPSTDPCGTPDTTEVSVDILLEQQHTVFCLGGRMQSTVQCKDSDQHLLSGEVACMRNTGQMPWIGLGIRELRQNPVPSIYWLTLGAHAQRGLLCVCPQLFSHYRLRGGLRGIPNASVLREPGDFPETTSFESDKLARSRTEFRGRPNPSLSGAHAYRRDQRGAVCWLHLDLIRLLCVRWRHKKPQRRAWSTTIASPCQILRELDRG